MKDAKGKPFRLGIDTKDNIIVTLQTGKNITVYPFYRGESNIAKSGKRKEPNIFFITRNHQKFGNLGRFYPAIWKLSGTKEKIVEQCLFLRLLSFPSMIGVVLTAVVLKLLLFIAEKWRKLRSGM